MAQVPSPFFVGGHMCFFLGILTFSVLDGPNRQSQIASVQRTRPLSQAVPQFHVEQMLND